MALQGRHRYIVQKLDQGFGIFNESITEELVKAAPVLEKINDFFKGTGPSRIIFFYATAVDAYGFETGGHELIVSDGSNIPLAQKAIFFMKTVKRDDEDEVGTPVDPTSSTDGALTYGVLGAPLESMETVVGRLYKPMLEAQPTRDWGQTEDGERNEFMISLDSLVANLQESIKSLSSGLELTKPDRSVEAQANAAGPDAESDPMIVAHFMDVLEDWCTKVESYLDDSDRSRWETTDSGPDTELEYWRRRMQRLTNITDQLKTRQCKNVIAVLTGVTAQPDSVMVDRQRVLALIRQWRQIDVNITEAANEAKDNVKYLATLERFMEPLYSGDPEAVIDMLPALMNSIKMIHTIARYFNTTERMTKLFMKMTNQMIATCKLAVNGKDLPDAMWEREPAKLLEVLESCLRLNECYQEQYRVTKDKLLTMPKGKQFDFSETQIFGKFDLFCRRIIKLVDMFSTMQQFGALAEHRLEGMEPLLVAFTHIIDNFRSRGHDLLDFHGNKFDRDYNEFNNRIVDLETSLQHFINRSFESITSIEQSLALLHKYQSLLHRESLRADLDSKLTIIFHNYGLELAAVQEIYEKFKHNPPIARNMPPVAGNIMWARHLLKRIEDPMQRFEGNSSVLASKESKKIIKTYNKVARTLVAFEFLWYEAWKKSVEAAKAGLHATLIIRHPKTNRLYVNFDREILQLIREAKCLRRIGVEVPEAANMVLLQEEKFKAYYQELKYALEEYDRVTSKIIPKLAKVFEPHLQNLEIKLRPGMVTLTWTSMNIDAYKLDIHVGLRRLEELITKVNDIVDNRIEKNLKIISRAILVELPDDREVTLDDFVAMQETTVREKTNLLMAKNQEVETAVTDLIAMVQHFPLASTVGPVDQAALDSMRTQYNSLTYRALINATKTSLNLIKKRVCCRAASGFLFKQKPFFEVDVQLSVPSVRLSPTLSDVQRAINRSAVAVIGCSKHIFQWGQDDVPVDERETFFDTMGRDTEIIKVALLLTGALHGTKQQVEAYLGTFRKYDWIWKDDKDLEYKQFLSTKPEIEHYEAELQRFMRVEEEVEGIPALHSIGALALNSANLKLQLRNESRQWKVQYSKHIHEQARESMFNLIEYIRVTNNKLNLEVKNLDNLRFVMMVLKEIRERESSIEMEITPILDMYQMLENYLPGGLVDKEEMDQKSIIRSSWRKMVDVAEEVADALSAIQGIYKKQLLHDVKDFVKDVKEFRADFEKNGPMVPDIAPDEAVERLGRFKDQLTTRDRKMEAYAAGEELFALRRTPYPELVKTKKEVVLLDQLYGLYMDVIEKMEGYRGVLWSDVLAQIEDMQAAVDGYDARCKKLPKRLKDGKWKAYQDLRETITAFQDMLPLVEQLTKPSIKKRHWEEVCEVTKTAYPYEKESFCLQDVMYSPILEFKEDIEEICEGADKQLQIETKLAGLREIWEVRVFSFAPWKSRDVQILMAFGQVVEDLEEAQTNLQTLLSMRHVAPFRDEVQAKLTELSDTTDTLELWIKVQMMWTSLESVFMGGDIAKQMPLEAKKFAKIDKDWLKVMARAAESRVVVACCSNELLRNTLPVLYAELEKCQKSLEGYLEQKRNRFPRFYFVSNPVLLAILSQGSDPLQMQTYYEKVFDSISRVVHDRADKTTIKAILNQAGSDEEVIELRQVVKAVGNIEEWLGAIEKEMQMSLKALCEKVAQQCTSLPLREFVDGACGQFALLGLQLSWTEAGQEALEKNRTSKTIMTDTNKKQLSVLQELSSWCLTDLGSSMNRRKIETLVTIQVHQRDVWNDLTRLYKEKKGLDANDFEWLKQARFYWRANVSDKHGEGACVISVCDVDFQYSFEYLGCKERLVITTLTDRCYVTLTQALGMYLGGAPAGPAGTGKTETVKDLGRTLGVFVVVTNCTDQQRFTDMAKIFKGLCQAGLWGCFDEFNRIELPVLSVVAQQVLAITTAKRSSANTFTFPGDAQVISLNPAVGYFITMNPGYAGRQELPENLKVLFRGVTMMVPDREIIMKVKLCSVGYDRFTDLARKFCVLYRLCEQQLSKQKHYDFGLRNILSVLRTAGQTKRSNMQDDEEMLLMRTLRDMNLSKMVAQDVPLFLSLLTDLFPSVGMPPSADYPEVTGELEKSIVRQRIVSLPSWNLKVIQLYETTLVRHGIMTVGPPGAGKSTIIATLQEVLTQVKGIVHKRVRMNPKAIRPEEMFGETDRLSGEWLDGIFGAMWGKYNDRARKDFMWIICDGPVDAVWIENLNTVLDDNKILTLANGDRIPMTDNVKLMFEVEDLRNASPATVSRAGIIYVSNTDLDWAPVLKAWLATRPDSQAKVTAVLGGFFEKFIGGCDGPKDVGHLFNFITRQCSPAMDCSRVGAVQATLRLLHGLLQDADLSDSPDDMQSEVERLVMLCVAWGVGGVLEPEDRERFDGYFRELAPANMPPNEGSLFGYCVNLESMEWDAWSPEQWEYPSMPAKDVEVEYSTLLVPTKDSTSASFLLQNIHKQREAVLMIGGSGTAKTTTAQMFFDAMTDSQMLVKKVNFSSATTPGMFQLAVEGELDKRGGKNFGPPGGKSMTFFLDDLSMPEVNTWGDQPTLELVRQLVETKGVCFLDKDKRGDVKTMEDLLFVGAMSHPGGGKNDIPNRAKRHFFIFNMITPSEQAIFAIYGAMLSGRFPRDLPTTTEPLLDLLTRIPASTVKLWSWVRAKLLPSPAKFHYIFNLRELSRVFQGVLRCPADLITTTDKFLHLWRHECQRVFMDKLTTTADKTSFLSQLDSTTKALLEALEAAHGADAKDKKGKKKDKKKDRKKAAAAAEDELPPALEPKFFVDFLHDDVYDEDGVLVQEAPKIYEDGGALEQLRARVTGFMGSYNEENPARKLDLVLFDDAMRHIMTISRVLGMPRGNLMLVGVGGSGKQSLTRLASFIGNQFLFQIAMSKSYNLNSLMDDFRMLYKKCGQERKQCTFIFTDAEIKDENFLEIFNSFLMTGEIANLIPKDELTIMAADLRPFAQKERPDFQDTTDFLNRYFVDCVRANLHMVLCMSPVNPKFPERARKFPGLVNGCTIDWFLSWPEEALVSVSRNYIAAMELGCEQDVKDQVMTHMGKVHGMVVDACGEYFQKMRRHVSQTPKSFLSFLDDYKAMYGVKMAEIDTKAGRVKLGLDKLEKGAEDVEQMKVELAEEEVKLRHADEATSAMLGKLERSSMDAKKEADVVGKIKEACEADAARIGKEKEDAEKDLAKAQPFVEEAERAVNSIKPNDLNELKKLTKPSDIIKLIFDCVGLLKMEQLNKVELTEITLGIGKEKKTFTFLRDSFKMMQTGMLSDARFLQNIFYFSKYEKDLMNDETIELLSPYLELEGFSPIVARNASKAAEGLCTWVKAMTMYHEASKIVKPKLEALRLAEARLQDAQRELDKAEQKLQVCQDVLDKLKDDFEAQMANKKAIEEGAANTRKKMEQATALIDGLAGERQRWTDDSQKFEDTKRRLVGDVALGCAFVSYCGPFNQDYRTYMVRSKFTADLKERGVPVTTNLDLTAFLVDIGTIGDWNMEGLPTDPLSIQNGILVTRSSRFPLLVDPQGQALNWVTRHERDRLPPFGTTTLNASKLRDQLEFCMMEGLALIISGVEHELDPMLTPVLEKQIITKAKSKYINVSDKLCEFNEEFTMYLTTRLPNPHFSPEDQAKATVVDFTVTQKGLEEQLLGVVIQKEQRSLEEQLNNVLEEVTSNTKSLLRLDELLLERLSANTGNLLEDEELIGVLADTKAKATEVNDKLVAAAETRASINEKREQYRPVATRGSVLYFAIVDMTLVNVMYQTSLSQFQQLFNKSMDVAEKAGLASKRVHNVLDSLTYLVYRYVNRGLYERDKLSFKLIVTMKTLVTANRLSPGDVTLLLKAGAALDIKTARPKPFPWMTDSAWLNALQLAADSKVFQGLPEELQRNEVLWKEWFADNEPETCPVPSYDSRLDASMGSDGAFLKLLLVRSLREDRTILCVNDFIRATDVVESAGARLPAMGPKYAEPVTDTVEMIFAESTALVPTVYLLSLGADPTDTIEGLARRKKRENQCVSMGEGQEPVAMRAINTAVVNGSWVLLQNCHLGLEFMEGIEDLITRIKDNINPDFRLFITTEPHAKFPIGLLQMSTKVTNEPPQGLRAGLLRSYTIIVDQDKLERVETAQWRNLMYAICFLHSVVQERRKFGPLGWCIPYEFNDGDLNACLTFLEKHLYSSQLSWPTLQYMVSDVQYGGKITDDLDRRLFGSYTTAWLSPFTLTPAFSFNPSSPINRIPNDFQYSIPDSPEVEEYSSFIQGFPDVDSPEVFGLHPNADLTFRFKEVQGLLNTILETQPKSSGGGSGRSREDVVLEKCGELLATMPEDYVEDEYLENINEQGGLGVPLNIFLFQELQRLQMVIENVRFSLTFMMQAIRGEVTITAAVQDAINQVYDARVPRTWTHSPGGDEISWICPTLGLWYSGLVARDDQLAKWLREGRPHSFWMTAFFNAQGFLTAVQQEVTRAHARDKWALDNMVVHTEITEFDEPSQVRSVPKEGVYAHGLFLDGAAYSKAEASLIESTPKVLFAAIPLMMITAVTKAQKKSMQGDYGPNGPYDCPVYKYPARTGRYFIFEVQLPSRDKPPLHYTLRGTALLCATE